MTIDNVVAIGIDSAGSLWLRPSNASFPLIYREAMQVHWDEKRKCLYSPTPREWPYVMWFKQIVDAAREQGTELQLTGVTVWTGIDTALQQDILAAQKSSSERGGGSAQR